MDLPGSRGPDRLREGERHSGPGDAREAVLDRPEPVALLHEGGILEDPSCEAPEHIFVMTKNPLDAPGKPVVVQIGFEEGTPVSVDHVPLGPVELLETLNDVAADHGVGRADVVEDRLVGMKSRGVYETPGGA